MEPLIQIVQPLENYGTPRWFIEPHEQSCSFIIKIKELQDWFKELHQWVMVLHDYIIELQFAPW